MKKNNSLKRSNSLKKNICMAACMVCMLLFCLTGCQTRTDSEKLTIVATLFPQYDFTRQIVGDYADVVMLLPPGVESHSYDLRPSDMITIRESDMFIYTGKYMETWAESIIESLDDSVRVVDVSTGIELVKEDDDHDHEHHEDETEDDHEEEEAHDHEEEHEEIEEEDAHTGHHHEYDPHIWTSPIYAVKMVENILEALCLEAPEYADVFTENASAYVEQLMELDAAFREVAQEAATTTIYFGGRFAMTYFAREYGFECVAAYHDCSAESEPSISQVMTLIDEIREHDAKAVYYEELTDPKVARTIAEETGAELILLHSAHNVTRDEFDGGITYLDIMWNNVESLKEGLY